VCGKLWRGMDGKRRRLKEIQEWEEMVVTKLVREAKYEGGFCVEEGEVVRVNEQEMDFMWEYQVEKVEGVSVEAGGNPGERC
jgi:hypothetical protein